MLRFQQFEMNLRTGEIYKEGKRIKLQEQPSQVLALLVERPGELVTREELRKKLWPNDAFVDFDHGVNIAINKLRDALGDSPQNPRFIETLPRKGYRFIAAVESVSSAPHRDLTTVAASVLAEKKKVPSSRMTLFLGAVALLATLGIVLFRSSTAKNARQPGIKSLAVLPLKNLSGDPTQEYLADGMTEALIGRLSGIRDLRVISRTSAMRFKDTQLSVPEIAKTLQVDAIVEGSILREGNRIRVRAQLIRAATDEHSWSEAYDRELQNVLSLQSDVAQAIAQRVEVTITGEEHARLTAARPVSSEVYETYLKGMFFQNKETPDAVRTAIRYFNEAIEKDPEFADAYARLSGCYAILSYMSEMRYSEAFEAAKVAAQKAVDLNPNLDQAHEALAGVAAAGRDWTQAETEYRRAIQLNPNSVDAHTGYFYLLLILKRWEEAGEQEREARVADPLSPQTVATTVSAAYFRRQYNDGLIKARNAIELYPQVSILHDFLSNLYAATGQDKLSAQEILLAEEAGGAAPERLVALRAAYAAAGPQGLRRKRIELNKRSANIDSYNIAIDCAAVGDRAQAILWLEKALRGHDPKISLISVEPIFDGLRADPRFVDLMRRMNFPT